MRVQNGDVWAGVGKRLKKGPFGKDYMIYDLKRCLAAHHGDIQTKTNNKNKQKSVDEVFESFIRLSFPDHRVVAALFVQSDDVVIHASIRIVEVSELWQISHTLVCLLENWNADRHVICCLQVLS